MQEYPPINIAEQAAGKPRKRVVVTGASGLVWSYLVAELLSRGTYDVTIALRTLGSLQKIRDTWKAESFPHDPAVLDIAAFRPGGEKELAETFAGADIVFNCAGAVAIGGTDRGEIIHTNVSIARTVAKAALAARPGVLVHVSSVAALLSSTTGRVDSDSPPGCDKCASAYARSKYLSELEIARAAEQGLRTVTVNPVTILGWSTTGQGSGAIIPVIASGVPFYPTGVTGWVDAKDVARAMVLLSGCTEAAGRRFVLSSCNTPYKRLLAEACRTSWRKPPRFHLPEKAARTASAAEVMLCKLTRRKRLLTPEMVKVLYGKHYYDGEGIKKYVNFEYSPLGQTVERLVKLYLESKRDVY